MHASTILRATSRVRIGRISSADAGSTSNAPNPHASAIFANWSASPPSSCPGFSTSTFQLSSLAMTGKALAIAGSLALMAPLSVAVADDSPIYQGSAAVTGPALLSLDGKRILLWGLDAPV